MPKKEPKEKSKKVAKKPRKAKPKLKPKVKKAKNPSIKNLGEDQREFIEEKVKELGTMKEVELFYCLDDAVSYFSRKVAKKLKLF